MEEQYQNDVTQGMVPDQQMPLDSSQQFQDNFSPRKLTFLALVLKTFAGLAGGIAGTVVLLLIFLGTSSILQPIIGSAVQGETMSGEVSPLFMVVLMAMVFSTSLISSMLSTLFLSYTERDRYTRIATTMSQVFIINIVIFTFVLPIYLTTSTTRIELTIFSAILQVILSSASSALILELIHDQRYALLSVYTTMLGIMMAMGVNFFLYYVSGNATLMMFAALPIIWSSIGFFQGALTIFYNWLYETWGNDFLASTATFGMDYGIPDTSEEEQEAVRPDVEGSDFLKR